MKLFLFSVIQKTCLSINDPYVLIFCVFYVSQTTDKIQMKGFLYVIYSSAKLVCQTKWNINKLQRDFYSNKNFKKCYNEVPADRRTKPFFKESMNKFKAKLLSLLHTSACQCTDFYQCVCLPIHHVPFWPSIHKLRS